MRKTAQPTHLKFIRINDFFVNNTNTNTNPETPTENEVLLNSNEDGTEFSLEPLNLVKKSDEITPNKSSVISYNMLLSVEQNVTVTNISLKLKVESIGIKAAVVILIFDKEKPDLQQYEKYNDYTPENRDKKIDSQNKEKYEVCYFEFYDNQIDLYFELPIFKYTKYILVKFVRPKENAPKSISVTHIKTLGSNHDQFEFYEELKQMVN